MTALLKVSAIEQLTSDAVALTFEVPAAHADQYGFEAGQYLTVRHRHGDSDERRNYSICALPGSSPRVAVRRVEGGVLSSWLTSEVCVGDLVEVDPPGGRFHTGGIAGGRHLLLAAGSGITPMIGIAQSLLLTGADVILVYLNRRTSSVMFIDELADIKDRWLDRFELIHVLSREPRDVDLFSGRLDDERLKRILDRLVGTVDHAWLCGPHELITRAQDLLDARGVQVHRELFYVEESPPEQATHVERPPSGATCEVSVVRDGRTSTGDLPTDRSLLDAAQQLRADLPFACKGGVCGTCRARVTAGEVDMRRNYALEDAEVAAGFVLTCQSFPVSPQVAIDYDS